MLLLLAAGGLSYVTDGRVYCKDVRDFSDDCEMIVSSGEDGWPISIFLTTVQQHNKIASGSTFVPFGCASNEDPTGIDVTYTFQADEHDNTFRIAEAGKYAVCSYNCNGAAPTDWSFRIRHSWGWLDEEIYPLTYIPMCEAVLYLVLFIASLVNRRRHKAMRLAIHTVIMVALGIHFVGAAISAGFYMVSNFDGTDQRALIVPEVFALINNFCVLCLCLILAAGLSIARPRLPPGQLVPIVCDCFAFAGINAVLVSSWFKDAKSELSLVVSFVAMYVIAYIIFLFMILKLFKESYGILRQHLAMIRQCGIDPKRTPTRRKMRMLQRLREVALVAFLVFVVSTFFAVWDLIPIWVAYLIIMVADFIVYGAVSYLYRIREKMAATYGDDVDAYIANSSRDEGNLAEWRPGMILPPLPKVAYRSAQVHDAPTAYEEPGVPDGKNSSSL
jgi:hypothetical protein